MAVNPQLYALAQGILDNYARQTSTWAKLNDAIQGSIAAANKKAGAPATPAVPADESTPAPAAPSETLPGGQQVRLLNYGPIVNEYHRDAMFGPQGNALGPDDVAASPDLGYKLGSLIDLGDGKLRRVADWSYLRPGVPTSKTIELRDKIASGKATATPIGSAIDVSSPYRAAPLTTQAPYAPGSYAMPGPAGVSTGNTTQNWLASAMNQQQPAPAAAGDQGGLAAFLQAIGNLFKQ